MTMKNSIIAATAAVTLLSLTACGSESMQDTEAAGEIGDETLATLIGGGGNLSTSAGILRDSGLQTIFDGNAPYTVFAPTDAAFEAVELPLDDAGAQAAQVAIMREHIVPGFLTRADIEGAIESAGGSVEMQTMGSNTLTFSMDGDELLIAASDGSGAHVAGAGQSGENGTLFAVDSVLKSLDAPG